MTNKAFLAALAPPALRCIEASLPKNAAGATDNESNRVALPGRVQCASRKAAV
mgnify:CR=1 FL=1